MHTTNYTDALILPSADCGAVGRVPDKAGTIAALQYELLTATPYQLTSDDLLLEVTARRGNVAANARAALRQALFSKGQPCLRASPLVKTYGWAIHHDAQSRVAVVSPDDPGFAALMSDPTVDKVAGMRSRR